MLRRVFVTALAVGLVMFLMAPSASLAGAASALPPAGDMMHVGGEVLAPSAFQDFCRRSPEECASEQSRSPRVTLTTARWQELVDINDIVNRTVIARSDQDLFGVVDFWTIAGRFGDCEDYALTKQQMLHQRGWPMGSVLMTVVRDENGEGHAVLTARTTRGDFVLDNRQPKIVSWNATPYQFIKRQSTLNPRIWLALAPGLSPARESSVAALSGPKR
jgi:predicted transglutaminase-like cysteine proteinase